MNLGNYREGGVLPGHKEEGGKKKPSDIDVKLIHIHWFIIDHGAFHIDTKILYCKFYNNQVNSVQNTIIMMRGRGEILPIDCLSELKVHFYFLLVPQTEQL